MKTFKVMLKTELKLSLRGLDMLIFAFIMPIVILIILAFIYGDKPAFEGADYTFIDQSFGALTAISICAGGVMGLPLVLSDYRGRHILKRFKVTPVSPAIILIVQIVIYTMYSLASLVSLFLIAKIFLGFTMHGSYLLFFTGWLYVMISMFSIGLLVGGVSKNNRSAGIIASILYFPMLIFSGATLPFEVMPRVMQFVCNLLPLTQGIKLLKAAALGLPFDSILLPLVFLLVMSGACIAFTVSFFKWD